MTGFSDLICRFENSSRFQIVHRHEQQITVGVLFCYNVYVAF